MLANDGTSCEPSQEESELHAHIVSSAIQSLAVAELLIISGKGRWEITQNGREVLSKVPAKVDLAYLRQFEAYNQYWSKVKSDNWRRKSLGLRFECYAAGRMLFFNGHFVAGARISSSRV
jgi:hypothetical protein